MRKTLFALICMILFVAACQVQDPAPQEPITGNDIVDDTPTPPEEEMEPEEPLPPEDQNTTEVTSGLDKAFGSRDAQQVISTGDIVCDPEESSLTFRFRNLDDVSWQLDQKVPFPPPTDIAPVRVTLNGYEVNGHRKPLSDGKELFGPETLFSDNCGGTELLGPGEEVECTVSPVFLKQQASYGHGANELRINGAGADGIVRFTCG